MPVGGWYEDGSEEEDRFLRAEARAAADAKRKEKCPAPEPTARASSGPADPRLIGPWRWLGNALVHDTGRRDVVITGGRNPGELVTCERPSGLLRPLDTASPVARLIAAAPALAKALHDLCVAYEGERDGSGPVWVRARGALRTAGMGA